MGSRAFEKIMAGLEEARAYPEGAREGYETHPVEAPSPGAAKIRGRTGRSRPARDASGDASPKPPGNRRRTDRRR